MKYDTTRAILRSLSGTVLAIWLSVVSFGGALADRTLRLDPGSVIPVRLNDTLSSNGSQKGDKFTATVKTAEGQDYGLPPGTIVDGIVTGARPRRDKNPGVIELDFERIRLPDGRSYAIAGSLIGLDNKSVDRRGDGRLVAKPAHQNDRLTYAGYGAGAGLIVGLLSRHPLEDTALGGLLGYGISALQKGRTSARDVVLKPGTEMGLRIDRRTTMTLTSNTQPARFHQDREPGRYHVTAERHDNSAAGGTIDHSEIGVLIDDRDVKFDSTVRPILNQDGVILVPAAPVLHAAKVPYLYDAATESLRATGTANPVRIAVGSNIAVVSGVRRVPLDASAQRINGSFYVPIKYLALATGYAVHYNEASRTVVLTSH